MSDWVKKYVPTEQQAEHYRILWLETQERYRELLMEFEKLQAWRDELLRSDSPQGLTARLERAMEGEDDESFYSGRIQAQRQEIARLHKLVLKLQSGDA